MPSFIDFEHKLIFCHPAKCAGTSFSQSYSLSSSPEHLLIPRPNLSLFNRLLKRFSLYLNITNHFELVTDFDFGGSDFTYLEKFFLYSSQLYGTHLPPSVLVAFVSQFLSISPNRIFDDWTFISIVRDPTKRLISYINYAKASRIHHLHNKLKNITSLSRAVDIFNHHCDELSLTSILGDYPFEFKKSLLFNQSQLPSTIKIPIKGGSLSVQMPHIKHYQPNTFEPISMDINPLLALQRSRWAHDEVYFSKIEPLLLRTHEGLNF